MSFHPPEPPPPEPAPLGAVVLCWLAALGLVLLGGAVAISSTVCEYDCTPAGVWLALGAVVAALAWIPLTAGAAALRQRRGRRLSTFGWPASGIGAALTCYPIGIALLAATLSDTAISGNLQWGAYWAGALLGWIALGIALVAASTRRRA